MIVNQIKTMFFTNIEFIGKKYFHLKNSKVKFSRRKLMASLGYSYSGASFIQWESGVVPGEKKLEKICGKINTIMLEKDGIIINLNTKDLLSEDLRVVIESKKDNAFNDIMNDLSSLPLNRPERQVLALLRINDFETNIVLNNIRHILYKKHLEKDLEAKETTNILASLLLRLNS